MIDEAVLASRQMEQLVTSCHSLLQKERDAEQEKLAIYETRLDVLEVQFAHAPGPASKPLTVPALFGRSYDENFISDYLAYVLDPRKNGIGEAPLAQFLSLVGIDPAELPLSEVKVHREYTLENGRIDLLLEWPDRIVVGIENKILSAEGPEQTLYYAEVIHRLFAGMLPHLVYLTRGGQEAMSDEFQPLSYAQLTQGLREVRLPADTTTRRRVLWEDFLEHLKEYIVMSVPSRFEFSEKAQLYLSHLDMFKEMRANFRREWEKALTYIERRLYPHLDGGPWTTRFTPAHAWQQVRKDSWESSTLAVYYQYTIEPADLRPDGQKISFMAQAEGAQQEDFLKHFDRRKHGLEGLYQDHGIVYRPPHRRYAIAWKEYDIPSDVNEIVPVMLTAWAEFRFLEAEIDQVLAELQEP